MKKAGEECDGKAAPPPAAAPSAPSSADRPPSSDNSNADAQVDVRVVRTPSMRLRDKLRRDSQEQQRETEEAQEVMDEETSFPSAAGEIDAISGGATSPVLPMPPQDPPSTRPQPRTPSERLHAKLRDDEAATRSTASGTGASSVSASAYSGANESGPVVSRSGADESTSSSHGSSFTYTGSAAHTRSLDQQRRLATSQSSSNDDGASGGGMNDAVNERVEALEGEHRRPSGPEDVLAVVQEHDFNKDSLKRRRQQEQEEEARQREQQTIQQDRALTEEEATPELCYALGLQIAQRIRTLRHVLLSPFNHSQEGWDSLVTGIVDGLAVEVEGGSSDAIISEKEHKELLEQYGDRIGRLVQQRTVNVGNKSDVAMGMDSISEDFPAKQPSSPTSGSYSKGEMDALQWLLVGIQGSDGIYDENASMFDSAASSELPSPTPSTSAPGAYRVTSVMSRDGRRGRNRISSVNRSTPSDYTLGTRSQSPSSAAASAAVDIAVEAEAVPVAHSDYDGKDYNHGDGDEDGTIIKKSEIVATAEKVTLFVALRDRRICFLLGVLCVGIVVCAIVLPLTLAKSKQGAASPIAGGLDDIVLLEPGEDRQEDLRPCDEMTWLDDVLGPYRRPIPGDIAKNNERSSKHFSGVVSWLDKKYQFKAMYRNDPYYCNYMPSPPNLKEQYALATIFFSGNGGSMPSSSGSGFCPKNETVFGMLNSNTTDEYDYCSWRGVYCRRDKSVAKLDLSRRGWSGPIPSEISILESLESLDLSFNAYTGTLPSELGELSRLKHLMLAANDLTGQLPTSIGRLQSAKRIYLDENSWTGTVPDSLCNLREFDLEWLAIGFGVDCPCCGYCSPPDDNDADSLEEMISLSISASYETSFSRRRRRRENGRGLSQRAQRRRHYTASD